MARRINFGKEAQPKAHESSAAGAKIELRRWLVEQLGGKPRVLDCFCAGGEMWRKAYRETKRYLGLDKRQHDDARATIVCDSRRYLRHADAKLDGWDIFDLDAFGSPLEHLAIICSRILVEPGRRLGFVLTDGTGFNAAMNPTNRGLLAFVGVARHDKASVQHDYQGEIFEMGVRKALSLARLRIIEAKRAEHRGGPKAQGACRVQYVALLTEREE